MTSNTGDSAMICLVFSSRKLCAGGKSSRVRSSSACLSAMSRRLAVSSAGVSKRFAPSLVARSSAMSRSRAARYAAISE